MVRKPDQRTGPRRRIESNRVHGHKDEGEDRLPRIEPGLDQPDSDRAQRRQDDAWDRYWMDHQLRWTPWLVIRANEPDWGDRVLPSGTAFWESPDISVESSDYAKNIVAGEPNYVHALIFNLGKAPAVPLRVDFYWANPSLGLGPATMNLIGTEWVEVDPRHSIPVRCSKPWIPVYENSGHECLMVHCSNPLLDPMKVPFQPTFDRHVGQRNVTVLKGSPGTLLNLSLGLFNPWPVIGRTLVTVRGARLAVQPDWAEQQVDRALLDQIVTFQHQVTSDSVAAQHQHQAMSPSQATMVRPVRHRQVSGAVRRIVLHPGSTGSVAAKLDEASCILPCAEARTHLGQRLIAADLAARKSDDRNSSGTQLNTVILGEFEYRKLHVTFGVPHDARRGEFLVHRLTQTTNDLVVGGYTVVVKIL